MILKMIRMVLLVMLLCVGVCQMNAQTFCGFTFKRTVVKENFLKEAKIPAKDRLKHSDSLAVCFMEGFTDSIAVFVDGIQVYTGKGIENYSTGFSGMSFRIHKDDLGGKVMEVFSLKKMVRTTVVISNSEARVLLFRILAQHNWLCDLRNYRVRLY